MPPDCNDCGAPATRQYRNGRINRGKGLRVDYVWLCDSCAEDWEWEREEGRNG